MAAVDGLVGGDTPGIKACLDGTRTSSADGVLRRPGESLRQGSARALRHAYHRVYAYGDSRSDWLRGPSRAYLRAVLLEERTLERGFARADGVRRLLDEHDAGRDHSNAPGLLLGLELWSRQFADGDGPPGEIMGLMRGRGPARGERSGAYEREDRLRA